MRFGRAAILVLLAFFAACSSDNDTSGPKKDGVNTNIDGRIDDGPASPPDLPADTAYADLSTGRNDVAPGADAATAEVASTAEVSSEAAASSLDAAPDFSGSIEDLALASPDAEESVDLSPLEPGQCRLSADCHDRLKPFCARIGVCVECEWNQQCREPTPYCVGQRCAPSPEGWLDGGSLDVTAVD